MLTSNDWIYPQQQELQYQGGESRVRAEAQLQLIGNVRFLVRKKSPCHPVWGARGFQATMAFFHSIFSERESFAMINRDEDDEERDRLQRHLRGVDDVRDVLPSLRASPPIRGVRVGTYPSSHQSRGASLEWYRLP